MHSSDKITRVEFDEALARYPALLQSISIAKSSKGSQDQPTLEQLDKYRFEVAPDLYYNKADLEDPKAESKAFTHADVAQLVRWKLKHGTFRPNLLKLAESNTEEEVRNVTKEAFDTYKADGFGVTKAINKLTTLKGIGPATASLLLSVHDAASVVFFGDEVFLWICCGGKKATIKYSLKEYEDLVTKSRELIKRLEIDARSVEKVGFVLMKEAAELAEDQGTAAAKEEVQEKKRKRMSKPIEVKQPTEMTEERRSQLVKVAAKGRAARVAKKEARLVKGAKFKERVDAARAAKKDGSSIPPAAAKAGTKRKSDVTTRAAMAAAKRSRRSNA